MLGFKKKRLEVHPLYIMRDGEGGECLGGKGMGGVEKNEFGVLKRIPGNRIDRFSSRASICILRGGVRNYG